MSLESEVQKKKRLDTYTDFELAHELFRRYESRALGSKIEFKTVESKLSPGITVGKNIIIQAGKRSYPIYLFFAADEQIYYVDIDTPYKQTPIPMGDSRMEEHMLMPSIAVEKRATEDSFRSEGPQMV